MSHVYHSLLAAWLQEEQQLRLRPAEIPEWRKYIKKQRFSGKPLPQR